MDGTVELTIPGTSWAIGSNLVRAAYVGSGSTGPASSVGSSVAISKAVSSISWSLPSKVKSTSKAVMTVKVRAAGVPAPAGSVHVYDGSKRILTFTLSTARKGTRTLNLPRITTKGSHRIKAVYAGSSTVLGRSTTYRSLRVY